MTNHYWDSDISGANDWYKPQNFEHIRKALPLPQAEEIDFLFGCETDMNKRMTLGIPSSKFDDFDFIIIPPTHLHITGFTIPSEYKDSHEKKAKIWVERLDAVLNMTLPFHKIGFAHLACPLIYMKSREDYLKVLDMIPSEDMERLFSKAAQVGCGIELNQGDMKFSDDEADKVLRMFRIAKECGCKFTFGSDSHTDRGHDTYAFVCQTVSDALGLKEDDIAELVR